jgi:ATP-dependent RNA helicase DDX55/SPB4
MTPSKRQGHTSTKTFSELSPALSQATLHVLNAHFKFSCATPVQEATIPLFMSYKDVSVDACTGSGKTLAFVVPIVEKLRSLNTAVLKNKKKKHHVVALILSPTRELAMQIRDVMETFCGRQDGEDLSADGGKDGFQASVALLVGGKDPNEDTEAIKRNGCHVIIGTPGRVDDVFTRLSGTGYLDLKSSFEMLILDEADRLLDMGFQRQLDSIMMKVPRQRRTGLFSATQTDAVKNLARAGLRNPVRVAVSVSQRNEDGTPGQTEADSQHRNSSMLPSTLEVRYAIVEQRNKIDEMMRFVLEHQNGKGIIYFLTCACVDYFGMAIKVLSKAYGFHNRVYSLHGRMKQGMREASLDSFAKAKAGVLLATDVAARGLDFPDIAWVLQYDPPQDPNSFVHRCGRTARMGREGMAMVFLTPEEETYVRFLELRKVPLKETVSFTDDARGTNPSKFPLDILRNLSETDRQAMEFGTRAFVSYLRAYREHVCKYIFQFQDLDMGWLASSFGALRLPKMKEIKKAARLMKLGQLEGFQESTVDIDAIPFKEIKREKQRMDSLKKKRMEAEEGQDKNDHKQQRQTQNLPKKHTFAATSRLTASKRRTLETRQELADLEDDYALWKKLKKGKITQAEYNAATEIDEDTGNGGLLEAAIQKKVAKKKKRNKRLDN